MNDNDKVVSNDNDKVVSNDNDKVVSNGSDKAVLNDRDSEDWWSEDYWAGSKFEDDRNFLLWFGHWFVELVVVVLFLTEAIFYIFHFLNSYLTQ